MAGVWRTQEATPRGYINLNIAGFPLGKLFFLLVLSKLLRTLYRILIVHYSPFLIIFFHSVAHLSLFQFFFPTPSFSDLFSVSTFHPLFPSFFFPYSLCTPFSTFSRYLAFWPASCLLPVQSCHCDKHFFYETHLLDEKLSFLIFLFRFRRSLVKYRNFY